MFGGADLRQMRLVAALLLLIFGTAAIISYQDKSNTPAQLGENHITRHTPGVLVPVRHESATRPQETSPGLLEAGGRIDINNADESALQALPGIGPARAQAIVDERNRGGLFLSLNDLTRVPGIGERTVQRLEPYITATLPVGYTAATPDLTAAPPLLVAPPAQPVRIRVNVANLEELQELRFVGPALAQRIIDHRQRHGLFRRPEDMLRVSGLGPRFLEENRHRLAFD